MLTCNSLNLWMKNTVTRLDFKGFRPHNVQNIVKRDVIIMTCISNPFLFLNLCFNRLTSAPQMPRNATFQIEVCVLCRALFSVVLEERLYDLCLLTTPCWRGEVEVFTQLPQFRDLQERQHLSGVRQLGLCTHGENCYFSLFIIITVPHFECLNKACAIIICRFWYRLVNWYNYRHKL